ncbi:MAG: argininosuccinate lyase [Coriobacteriales bacterium]|jgi:argininosuccinate lyase|nr:argininosuccinate lyase [Coriobacteriales bacterium]
MTEQKQRDSSAAESGAEPVVAADGAVLPAAEPANASLWGGRFQAGTDTQMQTFGASLPTDQKLWREDIQGSKAHARMLGQQGILASEDVRAILQGFDDIAADIAEQGYHFYDIADEDVHMSLERELTRRIGAAGKGLHTGRSRNDQVATDTRLFCKRQALLLATRAADLRQSLLERAEAAQSVIMPGYTHLQKAQPVLLAHHLLAWQWMLARDHRRLLAAWQSADVLVLGSAALAGTSYPLDRQGVADELGFGRISPNSLDAVSDRDFVCDLIYACALVLCHLSRISEELILWSSDEFGFITLSDAWSTGSSIMPQKKNPDFAELVRGKTGRVYGDLITVLVLLKGLPLAYNKDLQEDKPALLDALAATEGCLQAVQGMIATMTVNAEAMRAAAAGGFTAATDLADYLVAHGMAFRDAHAVVGRVVLHAEAAGKTLEQLSLEELRGFSELFDPDALQAVDIAAVVGRRTTVGGTAPERVSEQLQEAKRQLQADREEIAAAQHRPQPHASPPSQPHASPPSQAELDQTAQHPESGPALEEPTC